MTQRTPLPLRRALPWSTWWPAVRGGLGVVALFAGGLWLARAYQAPVEAMLHAHATAGALVFVASTVVAVLLPMLSNLALVPLAVLAWGPGWTAAGLLAGWTIGSAASFALGRYARPWLLQRLPGLQRHADIDRLIHPSHRLLSLVLLRMTFPVDVLSYALGLFSRRTSAVENALSTLVGAAPFALVFGWFPALDGPAQAAVFVGSVALFAVYARWILRRPAAGDAPP